MLDPWYFAVVALAAYRITRFVVYDSLIGASLESRSNFSMWLDRFAYTEDGANRSWLRGKIGDLLNCPFCVGSWIALATWAAWYYGGDPLRIVVTVWAVLGAQSLLNATERKLR